MSIPALAVAGHLHRIGEELVDADEDPTRTVYGTDRFVSWREDDLPYYEGSGSELSPDEEVDDFLRRFQLGTPVTHMARLQPTHHGVWEVKLSQSRLFGWFPEPGVLILDSGADLGDLKGPTGKGYDDYFDEVRQARRKLGLDYVAGDIRAVLPSPTK